MSEAYCAGMAWEPAAENDPAGTVLCKHYSPTAKDETTYQDKVVAQMFLERKD